MGKHLKQEYHNKILKDASRSFIILELFAGNLPTLKRALHFTQIHWYRYNVSVFMTIIRNEVDMERTKSQWICVKCSALLSVGRLPANNSNITTVLKSTKKTLLNMQKRGNTEKDHLDFRYKHNQVIQVIRKENLQDK